MSFQHHESCPRCGSKDNLARYADGSAWCFGCHYHERATHAPRAGSVVPSELPEHPRLPDDCGTQFSEDAVAWLAKYHLRIPEAIYHGVVYSPSRQQIIYQMGNVWQARNLNPEVAAKRKCFTSGDVNECHHIYGHSDHRSTGGHVRESSEVLVIVEDPVSAMRIASLCPSMPLLGSHLATKRLNAVAGLYKRLAFWLDSDKLKESRAMAERAKLIGIETCVIYTDLDPKEYPQSELKEILK